MIADNVQLKNQDHEFLYDHQLKKMHLHRVYEFDNVILDPLKYK